MPQQMTNDAELWDYMQQEHLAQEDFLNSCGTFYSLDGEIYTDDEKQDYIDNLEHSYYLATGRLPEGWLVNQWENCFYPVKWARDEETFEGYWRDL